MTLGEVAQESDTSVQTVLRIFGSKAALLDAALGSVRDGQRGVVSTPDSVAPAVAALFVDYEHIGDRVIRVLADEDRVPGFAEVARIGRSDHRAWVEESFAPQLVGRQGPDREHAVLALIAATDVYVWKLLRRDLGLSRDASEAVVARLCTAATLPVASKE